MITSKNVTSRVLKGFPLTWPGDLDVNPKRLSFELDLDFIEANILSKFH